MIDIMQTKLKELMRIPGMKYCVIFVYTSRYYGYTTNKTVVFTDEIGMFNSVLQHYVILNMCYFTVEEYEHIKDDLVKKLNQVFDGIYPSEVTDELLEHVEIYRINNDVLTPVSIAKSDIDDVVKTMYEKMMSEVIEVSLGKKRCARLKKKLTLESIIKDVKDTL